MPLDSANHIILEDEAVWPGLQAAILEFTGQGACREAFSFKKAFASLSARETQIVAALCEGHDNEEIADRLGLSGKTVRNHVSNILSKTNTRNRLDLVVKALK